MSGPQKGCPEVILTFIATLPLNTGGPLERVVPKPKPPEMKTMSRPTRRTVGDHLGAGVVRENAL